MMPFAVVVTFEIAPGQMSAFLPLMQDNARASLKNEAGCQQFDVATDPSRPNQVLLYEIYDDADAFAVHLCSKHFMAFDAAVSTMIADKGVWTYSQVHQ